MSKSNDYSEKLQIVTTRPKNRVSKLSFWKHELTIWNL